MLKCLKPVGIMKCTEFHYYKTMVSLDIITKFNIVHICLLTYQFQYGLYNIYFLYFPVCKTFHYINCTQNVIKIFYGKGKIESKQNLQKTFHCHLKLHSGDITANVSSPFASSSSLSSSHHLYTKNDPHFCHTKARLNI